MCPSTFRRLEAQRVMKFGEQEPSHLPSLNVLNIAKHENVKKNRLHEDPILAIVEAKYRYPYQAFIKDIGYDKLNIHYWSNEQLNVTREIFRSASISSCSIDAKGSLIKKIRRSDSSKSHEIFLYEVTVRYPKNKKLYSCCNMVSERHDTETIKHWLTRWITQLQIMPMEVTIDMSKALMAASIRTFTDLPTLSSYLDVCFQIVTVPPGERRQSLPKCFVRSDVAHVVHLMAKFPSLRGKLRRTRQLYLRSLCLVVQSTDFQELAKLLQHIFMVALSETEGVDEKTGENTSCEESKTYLQYHISGFLLEEDTTLEEMPYPPEFSAENIESSTKRAFRLWTETTAEEVSNSISPHGVRGNQQYEPKLVDDILHLSDFIPMWTGIMVPHFGYGKETASSAIVESSFNDLKNRTCKNLNLPARLDDFLLTHIQNISGSMKLAQSSLHPLTHISDYDDIKAKNDDWNNMKSSPAISSEITQNIHKSMQPGLHNDLTGKSEDNNLITENQEVENWKGLGTSKKRPRKSYLEPNSEMLQVDFKTPNKIIPIGLLKNGNLDTLKPVRIGKGKITVKNTCGFDSLLQLACAAYCDSPEYKKELDKVESESEMAKLVISMIKSGPSPKLYRQRAVMLRNILPSNELPARLILVDAALSIGQVVDKSWSTFPTGIEQQNCSSSYCPRKEITNSIPSCCICIPDNDSSNLEVRICANLTSSHTHICQSTFNDLIGDKTCVPEYAYSDLELSPHLLCKGNRRIKRVPSSSHIMVEVIQNNIKKLVQMEIEPIKLPTSIQIIDQNYILRGVVAYRGGADIGSIGHFTALCRGHNGEWEEYDDLRDKVLNCNPQQKRILHLLFYTV